MLTTTWETVSNLDRFIDDVMGSALGAATNPRSFNPSPKQPKARPTKIPIVGETEAKQFTE